MIKSYDVVGEIAIVNHEISKKEADKLLKERKNIKTVAYKKEIYSGEYRTPKVRIISGKKNKETIHKENKVRLKLNIEKCYFSTRSGTERLRICGLIKKGEEILVMFSGVAPFPIVISKNSKAKEIIGVEINPLAHKYALENLRLNKIRNVKLYKGDVRGVLPKIRKRFDRVIMPLPKSAEDFLDLAVKKIKPGGFIHFYSFGGEEEIKDLKKKIKKKVNCKILRVVKCGQYAPRKQRLCFDLKTQG